MEPELRGAFGNLRSDFARGGWGCPRGGPNHYYDPSESQPIHFPATERVSQTPTNAISDTARNRQTEPMGDPGINTNAHADKLNRSKPKTNFSALDSWGQHGKGITPPQRRMRDKREIALNYFPAIRRGLPGALPLPLIIFPGLQLASPAVTTKEERRCSKPFGASTAEQEHFKKYSINKLHRKIFATYSTYLEIRFKPFQI